MARKVFKYPVPWDDIAEVSLPKGAHVLDVRPQGEAAELMLWALVDPDAQVEMRRLRIAGTGHPVDGNVQHISTFQMRYGALVFHIFEVLGDD